MLLGYIEEGIEKESENYTKAIEILTNARLPINLLVEHALNNSFTRLNISVKNQIDSLTLQHEIVISGQNIILPIALSEEQKIAIKSIYDLYKKDETIKQNNIKVFMEEWDKRENLKTLREWWDNISNSIQVTSVGKVLAHSNAQRCDKNLPSLD